MKLRIFLWSVFGLVCALAFVSCAGFNIPLPPANGHVCSQTRTCDCWVWVSEDESLRWEERPCPEPEPIPPAPEATPTPPAPSPDPTPTPTPKPTNPCAVGCAQFWSDQLYPGHWDRAWYCFDAKCDLMIQHEEDVMSSCLPDCNAWHPTREDVRVASRAVDRQCRVRGPYPFTTIVHLPESGYLGPICVGAK